MHGRDPLNPSEDGRMYLDDRRSEISRSTIYDAPTGSLLLERTEEEPLRNLNELA